MEIFPELTYRQLLFGFMILVLGCALPSPGHGQDSAAAIDWQSDYLNRHRLAGKIWDTAHARFVTPATLHRRLYDNRFVLLGEVHANPDHHALQARVIERLVAQGRRPAVVFEMFERAQQAAIAQARKHDSNPADRIGRATRMEARGWPWRLYKPLVETVLALELPIIGADLSRATVNRIAAAKLDVLGAKRVRALALDAPLSPRGAEIMRADIVAAHCGYAPQARLGGMIATQRARDAMLADALIAHAHGEDDGDGAVLIAGSGHVRNDFAVPAYLRQRAPDKAVVSVAFTEVSDHKNAPEDYLPAGENDRAHFDYLWFTPGSQPRDPCAAFEKRLRTLRRPAP